MGKLHGETITLFAKTQTGVDAFNRPIYTETAEQVENVIIGQPSTDDITEELNLSGKRIDYVLGIPKGDTHDWVNRKVEFWGEQYETVGKPMTGIQDIIPLEWGKNVKVARYE